MQWVYQNKNENILQFISKDVWQLQPRQILSWMKISLENGAGTILEYIVLVSRAHSKYAGGKLGLDVSSIGFFSKRFYYSYFSLQILWQSTLTLDSYFSILCVKICFKQRFCLEKLNYGFFSLLSLVECRKYISSYFSHER